LEKEKKGGICVYGGEGEGKVTIGEKVPLVAQGRGGKGKTGVLVFRKRYSNKKNTTGILNRPGAGGKVCGPCPPITEGKRKPLQEEKENNGRRPNYRSKTFFVSSRRGGGGGGKTIFHKGEGKGRKNKNLEGSLFSRGERGGGEGGKAVCRGHGERN